MVAPRIWKAEGKRMAPVQRPGHYPPTFFPEEGEEQRGTYVPVPWRQSPSPQAAHQSALWEALESVQGQELEEELLPGRLSQGGDRVGGTLPVINGLREAAAGDLQTTCREHRGYPLVCPRTQSTFCLQRREFLLLSI